MVFMGESVTSLINLDLLVGGFVRSKMVRSEQYGLC